MESMFDQAGTLRIVELKAENFKRLKAVRITPEGGVVEVTGKNGQGKSSVLDAIAAALGGASNEPEMPVRRGTKKATVIVDLGSVTVEWSRTSGGGKQLVVKPKDGEPLKSPQAVLDKLIGALTFDPLAFTRMKPDQQREHLVRITGLAYEFARIDTEREEHYSERTIVGRRVKELDARLKALPIVNGPDKEESLADLIAERDTRAAKVRENAEVRHECECGARQVQEHDATIRALEERIEEMQRELSMLREARKGMVTESERMIAAAKQLADPDVTEIDERIRTVEQRNAAARKKRERAEVSGQLHAAQRKHEEHSKAIEKCDERKLEAISGAKLPIDGLGISEDGVTYNGLPFSSCSASERLRVSVAIGLAMNPKVRVMLVHDGSLLDSDAMADLARIAHENDAQVWIERVSDGEGVGVVIEDGEVRQVEETASQ